MEVTVYRQASKERDNGTTVYKGEDTRPYADENMIMVADGLGGAAAIRHQAFNQDMFDPEKIVDVIMEGTFEDYSDPRLIEYIKKSFEELYAVKDCYTDNVNNMKKGGYFGSRLLAAIILHELFYSEDIKNFNYFAQLNAADPEGKQKILKTIGKHFEELVSTKLKAIAKKCNLVYESSYQGMALLGTTLCATLMHENEGNVECIYLMAGDSRPYVWESDLGLMQVIADEEGKDGGMTNYIRANEDKDFSIGAYYHIFAKPCIIFNASDGCFDSGSFLNPMAFELLILKSIIESDDCVGVSERLTEFFKEGGKHDDSSTIAMKIYGYDSFEALKLEASKRFEAINSEYLASMDELLDSDYIQEYAELIRKVDRAFAPFKDRLYEETAVVRWCEAEVLSGHNERYNLESEKLRKRIDDIKLAVKMTEKTITDVVSDNYVRFLSLTEDTGLSKWEQHKFSRQVGKIDSVDEKLEAASELYMKQVDEMQKQLEVTTEALKNILDQIYNIGVPENFDEYIEVDFSLVEECERKMAGLFVFFTELRKRKQECVKKLAELREKYIERNRAIASQNPEEVRRVVKTLIRDYGLLTGIKIREEEKNTIKEAAIKIEHLEEEKEKIECIEIPQLLAEAKKEHWDRNYVRIAKEIIYDNESESKISTKLCEEIQSKLDEVSADLDELKKKADEQQSLFDKYNKGYFALMKGEN